MNDNSKYSINLQIKYQPLEIIDIPDLIKQCTKKWQNMSICNANDSVIRLAVIEGEFHWHKHEKEDDFFLLLEDYY